MRVIDQFNAFIIGGGDPDHFTEEQNQDNEIRQNETDLTPLEDEKRRFFSFFELPNQPDISQANIAQLTPQASDVYRQQMIDQSYLIVIHCTHGVNRAGYMITRYLMDRLGVDPDLAISLVSEARGHTMNRPSYLRVLLDSEVLDYAREQARYSFLIDKEKYWAYSPAQRFKSRAFVNWRNKQRSLHCSDLNT